MSGRTPTSSEVAYGNRMAAAAYQHHGQMADEAERTYDEAERSGWEDFDKEWTADNARHVEEMAREDSRDARNWVWLAEKHPELLRDEPERDHEYEAGS